MSREVSESYKDFLVTMTVIFGIQALGILFILFLGSPDLMDRIIGVDTMVDVHCNKITVGSEQPHD